MAAEVHLPEAVLRVHVALREEQVVGVGGEIVGMPSTSRCTSTSRPSPSTAIVPSSCGNDRWIVHTTKPAAISAMTVTPATTLNAVMPMTRPTDRRGGRSLGCRVWMR